MNRTTRIIAIILSLIMLLGMAACGNSAPAPAAAPAASSGVPSGVEDGVLTVAMECAYAPYNWAQPDDSNGAVPIKGTNMFANGYDVMTAKQICEANGWELEIDNVEGLTIRGAKYETEGLTLLKPTTLGQSNAFVTDVELSFVSGVLALVCCPLED